MIASQTIDGKPRRPNRALVGFGGRPVLWLLTAGVMTLALVFGGGGTGQGLWADAVIQLSSLALLGFLIPITLREGTAGASRPALLLIAASVLLPLYQLLPLPPSLWSVLPERSEVVTAYRQAGIDLPWLPISLDPAATWRRLLSLLPPIAIVFATLRLSHRARRTLSLLIVAFGVVSVLLGFAQFMQGPDSPLRFFPISSRDSSVGFFANRNHYAALLYSVVPLAAAWMIGLSRDRRPERVFGLAVCLLVYVALVLGLGMALSRTGILLAVMAVIGSLLMAAVHAPRTGRRGLAIIAGAAVIGAILVGQFAFFGLLKRFDEDALADYRFRITEITLDAIRAYQPIGSGFGTFVPVYQTFEVPDALLPYYVNHAHNDWLEIMLEGGWPAAAALLGFLAWFGRSLLRVWRAGPDDERTLDDALARAASIVVVLILIHSMVEFPLRTTALMCLFAWCCALLLPPARSAQRVDSYRNGASRRPERGQPRGFPVFRTKRGASTWQSGKFR